MGLLTWLNEFRIDIRLPGKEKLSTFTHETLLKIQVLETHVDIDKTYSNVIA